MSTKDYNILLYNQDKLNSVEIHARVNEIYLNIIKYYLNQYNLDNFQKNFILDELIKEITLELSD